MLNFLPFAFCLLPFALYLLPFAFYLLPFAFCPLPFAFYLPLIHSLYFWHLYQNDTYTLTIFKHSKLHIINL
jgi:hypothetical protein